jgi:hypothetical protein
MIVPHRLNHRRRVVYAALRKALDRDQRIPKLFIFWDRNFATLDHFVISPYIEQAAARGWLTDVEKRDLTRALMHYMSHDYYDLPQYPEEFINIKPKSPAPVQSPVTPVPSVTDSQSLPPLPVRQAPVASLKMTLTPEMNPHYLIFREVMAVELRLLRDHGRSSQEMESLLLKVARDLNMQHLEPLLQLWSQGEFSLESLPIVSQQETMQDLIQLFYRAACEAFATPIRATSSGRKSETPEIIR